MTIVGPTYLAPFGVFLDGLAAPSCTRVPSIQALRVFSAAPRVMAFIELTDAPMPTFAFRKACASWNESSRAEASDTTRLASGVALTLPLPSSHPSLPIVCTATPAFGA